MPVSGSNAPPFQFAPPDAPAPRAQRGGRLLYIEDNPVNVLLVTGANLAPDIAKKGRRRVAPPSS